MTCEVGIILGLLTIIVVVATCLLHASSRRIDLMIDDEIYRHCIKYVEAMNYKEYEQAKEMKEELIEFLGEYTKSVEKER